jgi:UDP-N-acetylglucosamine 2-epimerase (non-hydrolysing)
MKHKPLKKIISVVGARPNFMKAAPIHKAFRKHKDHIRHLICHTGQHYDGKMSKIFFDELELPKPDFYLDVGSGSHAAQTAKVMIEFEKVIEKEKPDLIIVYGDVNSTVACSLVASKLGIRIAHVEAGLRSFDRTMPEEINRFVTDVLSDYLFVTEKSGVVNLVHEGIDKNKIYFVGNVMIDSLIHYLPKAANSIIYSELGIEKGEYVLVTLHRPSNVDSKDNLKTILAALKVLSQKYTVVFPVHPRTKKNIANYGLDSFVCKNVNLLEPLGYIDFLALIKSSKLIITDSGGIQEESTFLQVQCLTARENTERPVTVKIGTNRLLGTNWNKIQDIAIETLDGKIKKGSIPELWDGYASERIVDILLGKIT